jgi:transcription antitermination factor NusG
MLKAYGNTLNAKQKAYEISLRAIGTDDKEIAEASKHMHEAMKIRADLVKQYDDNQEKLESARINAKSRVDAAGVHANAAGKASGASLDDYAKRMQAIANERKISLTSGSRSAAAISSQVAEMAKHGQELGYTPEEAIDHIRELQMKTGQENKESDVVAKREGVVKPAMKALTRDGGFFDQLNETAGKVNFGSAKWSNAFREWKAGKITDDPALRKYILVLEDTRADVQQVLSRTGGVTNKVREAADRMFPETSSVREMRAVIDQARKIVSNINDANEETLAELRGKVDSDASPEELAGAAKPSSSSGAKGDGWGEVVRH